MRRARFSWQLRLLAGSSHFLHGRHQLRNLDADYRTLSGLAVDVQLKVCSVQHAQTLAYIAQPDAFDVDVRQLLFGDADTIVGNLDEQPSVAVRCSQLDFSASQLWREPVFQAILHHRLEQHAGHKRFERGFVDVLHNIQIVFSETRYFDVQVIVDELQLLAQRHKRLMLPQQTAQDVAHLQHYAARRIRIKAD